MKRFEKNLKLINEKYETKKIELGHEQDKLSEISKKNSVCKDKLDEVNDEIVNIKKQIKLNKLYEKRKQKLDAKNKNIIKTTFILELVSMLSFTLVYFNIDIFAANLLVGLIISSVGISNNNNKKKDLDKRKQLLDIKNCSSKDLLGLKDYQERRKFFLENQIESYNKNINNTKKKIYSLEQKVDELSNLYSIVYDHYELALLLTENIDVDTKKQQIVDREYQKVLSKVLKKNND